MELMKMETNENYELVVCGRELHGKLKVKTDYTKWFGRMVEYGFSLNQDFTSFLTESTGGRPSLNHILSLDMAKEIAMLQRTEKGKQIRRYFIQVEKEYNSPEKIIARALLMANDKINGLQATIEEQKPKVEFAKALESSITTLSVGSFAKILKQNSIDMGQNKLFEWLRDNGYIIKSGEDKNKAKQLYVNMGLFELEPKPYKDTTGKSRTSYKTKLTGKGQKYFINKIKKQSVNIV